MSLWQKFWVFVQADAYMAQALHFFSAGFVVFLAARFIPWWWAGLAFAAYTTFKELILDKASWGENHGKADWDDWAFNLLGVATTCAVLGLTTAN